MSSRAAHVRACLADGRWQPLAAVAAAIAPLVPPEIAYRAWEQSNGGAARQMPRPALSMIVATGARWRAMKDVHALARRGVLERRRGADGTYEVRLSGAMTEVVSHCEE